MAVKRGPEEEEEERERPGRKRSRLEMRGLGGHTGLPPPPNHHHHHHQLPVPSAKTRQIVEEKLQQLDEQEDSEEVSFLCVCRFTVVFYLQVIGWSISLISLHYLLYLLTALALWE